MNTQTIHLDVGKRPAAMPSLIIGQGDKAGTTLACELYDNGQALSLTGLNVKFVMRLPHQRGYYEVPGTSSGNVATFVIDETYAAAVAGTTDVAYVEILQGTSVIASTNRIHVAVLDGAKTDADPAGAYSNVIDEMADRLDGLEDDADALVDRLKEVEGGYVVAVGGTFDGETLVLTVPEDTELMANDLADARARLAEVESDLEECCEQVNGDLLPVVREIAGLTDKWLWLGTNLVGPTSAIAFSGTTATLRGAYSNENLVLS